MQDHGCKTTDARLATAWYGNCMQVQASHHVATAARIVSDPSIMGGEPTVIGTRIAAATFAAYLDAGHSDDDILEDYPSLPPDGIEAVRRWRMVQPAT